MYAVFGRMSRRSCCAQAIGSTDGDATIHICLGDYDEYSRCPYLVPRVVVSVARYGAGKTAWHIRSMRFSSVGVCGVVPVTAIVPALLFGA